jgi:hypothetical protein
VDGDVISAAQLHLSEFVDRAVNVMHADGRENICKSGHVDRLIVTAATDDLEPAWLDQLSDRGLLIAPLILAPGLAYVVRGSVTDGVFHGRLTRAAYFMPLRAEGEIGPTDAAPPLPSGELRAIPAPWAGWFNRRRGRRQWLGFSQALAFFGLLRGFTIHYRTERLADAMHAVSQGDAVCWYGIHEWLINGDAARELGWGHWRAFLDAGGPWPTEFRLKASPSRAPEPGHRESFVRRGPRCHHLWELLDPRDRPVWI